jgi:hypothetical protein
VAFLTCVFTVVCQLQRHKVNICNNKLNQREFQWISESIIVPQLTEYLSFVFPSYTSIRNKLSHPLISQVGFTFAISLTGFQGEAIFFSAWSYICLHGQFIRTFMQILISVIRNSILKSIMKIAKIMPWN